MPKGSRPPTTVTCRACGEPFTTTACGKAAFYCRRPACDELRAHARFVVSSEATLQRRAQRERERAEAKAQRERERAEARARSAVARLAPILHAAGLDAHLAPRDRKLHAAPDHAAPAADVPAATREDFAQAVRAVTRAHGVEAPAHAAERCARIAEGYAAVLRAALADRRKAHDFDPTQDEMWEKRTREHGRTVARHHPADAPVGTDERRAA